MKTLIASMIIFFVNYLGAIDFKDVKEIEEEYGTLKALTYYKELAKTDDINSMFRLAQIYSSGKVIEKNITKAHDLLLRASKLGDDKSTFYLGKIYLSKKSKYHNLTDAYNYFVKSANNGYAPAQNMIGQFLVNGIAVEKDYKIAVRYFERASKQNYIDAQCNLAFMYASGKGVFPNFGRAHQFALKGKELGNKKCQKVWKDYNLAKYAKDKGWKFNFYTKPE